MADQRQVPPGTARAGESIDALSRFEGTTEEFLARFLALQCRLSGAVGAAILRTGEAGQVHVLAAHPRWSPEAQPPPWLGEALAAAPEAAQAGTPVIRPLHKTDSLYGQPASQNILLVPLRGQAEIRGVAAYLFASPNRSVLAAGQERIELTASLLDLYEMRRTLQQRHGDTHRLRTAMEVVAAVNEHNRFAGAAMAFCNELAARWQCERVSLGFLKGRYVQLKALSHTEKFSRKMKLVQDIEAAMEECLDQDVEIDHPSDPGATYVSRGAAELSTRHGPTCVLSLPLRPAGEPVAVLTVERPIERPIDLAEAEALRLTGDLCTTHLANLHARDRWVGARLAAGARKGVGAVLGPKHTWIKLLAMGVMGFLAFAFLVSGQYQADAPFVLEVTQRQVVSAPFGGTVERIYVSPPDDVVGWGASGDPSWRLSAGDILDWPALIEQLAPRSGDAEGTAAAIRKEIRAASRQLAAQADPQDPTAEVKDAILGELNRLLTTEKLTASLFDLWPGLKPTERQADLLTDSRRGLLDEARRIELNRSLLASCWGGIIRPGPTVLAQMDTADLRLELTSKQAQRQEHLTEMDMAMAAGNAAQAGLAQVQSEGLAAEIAMLQRSIGKGRIVARNTGQVLQVALEHRVDARVETGDLLFEVAPLNVLRAELSVPEDEIADVVIAHEAARTRVELTIPPEVADAVRDALAEAKAAPEPLSGTLAQHAQIAAFEVAKVASDTTVIVRLAERQPWILPGRDGEAILHLAGRQTSVTWRCVGLRGELATKDNPGRHVGFVVERITPLAEVTDQKNVFRVRARLDETAQGMLPRAEGVAKINLGKRRFAWIWSRRLIYWVRMKLWI